AGIGLVMKLAVRIKNASGEVVLCNPRANVRNVFVMLGIDTRFQIFDHLGDAMSHFGNLLNVDVINVSL
ncbi:MAG: STAS domain-containing protein, partial [bacterium]